MPPQSADRTGPPATPDTPLPTEHNAEPRSAADIAPSAAPSAAPDTASQGRTQPVQSDGPVPRLPHERDESDDSQAPGGPQVPSQQDIGRQAHDDVESGQADTGRLPVTDRTYDRLKKSG